ncbi:hypothetical protein J3U96_12985 [Stenotrophomonas maltophilia]|nr:hypothetical protein J3U96_12985 [Stenotrophomonas maltophilia]
MDIKKNDVSFLQGSGSLEHSARYKFAHPNFDEVEDHIVRVAEQVGKARIVKYVRKSEDKGQYTYEYFNLSELEIGSYDEAQGASRTDSERVDIIESMRFRVNEIIRSIWSR